MVVRDISRSSFPEESRYSMGPLFPSAIDLNLGNKRRKASFSFVQATILGKVDNFLNYLNIKNQ